MNKADELHVQGLLFGADDAEPEPEEHGQVEEEEQPYEDVDEDVCEEAEEPELEAEEELGGPKDQPTANEPLSSPSP
eukprot:5441060-Amphidinium_carterae.1